MGQTQTTVSPPPSNTIKIQPFYSVLAKTLPPLSIRDYESIFSSLADKDDDAGLYWKEDTLSRFLEVPAEIGSIIFRSVSYLGALPTLEGVPVPLTKEALGIAMMVYTQNVPSQVLTSKEMGRLLFNSFAEIPPKQLDGKEKDTLQEKNISIEKEKTGYGAQIPVDTMINLISFLLSITTPSSLSTSEKTIETLTPKNESISLNIAKDMVSSMQSYVKSPSDHIPYDAFRAFLERDAPFFFDPFVPLFSRFLYDRQKWGTAPPPEVSILALQAEKTTDLMSLPRLAQISMFLPKERRLGTIIPLYAGSRDGFSMGMFESKVLKYPGPSMLLVRGSSAEHKEILFGIFISTPWKSSQKENFGDKSSILFQLSPLHTIYQTASYHTQFVYFHHKTGIGFGCAPPTQMGHHAHLTTQSILRHTSDPQVALSLDPSLEQGMFTHIPPGSTFQANPAHGEVAYHFEIDDVEVWGCGIDQAREEQRRAWEWERREAERRQNVRIREDLAGDRALLEMAGIIGGNRSGGSV